MVPEESTTHDKQKNSDITATLERVRNEYLALLHKYAADPQRSRTASPDEFAEWSRLANAYLSALSGRPDSEYANLELLTQFALLVVELARLVLCLRSPQCSRMRSSGREDCLTAHLLAVRVYRGLALGLGQSSDKFRETLLRAGRMLEHSAYAALLDKGVEYPSGADVREALGDVGVGSMLEEKMFARLLGPSKDPVEMKLVIGVVVRLYLHALTPTISKIAARHGLNPLPLTRFVGSWKDDRELDALLAALTAMLEVEAEREGCQYRGAELLSPEADAANVRELHHTIHGLYEGLGLGDKETALHHLRLAEEHYVSGKWDDCISNSRKFLECTLREVAVRHAANTGDATISRAILEKPAGVREYLESKGLLETKEKEALAKNYALLSHTGGHPYMAQNDQARLLRDLALSFARFVMLRLQRMLADK